MEREISLPASLEAEITLLGNMINDPESVDIAFEIIQNENEFFQSAHKIIYRAMINLSNRGVGINRVSLVDELMTTKLLQKAGDLKYVLEISESFITSANTRDLAHIIHNKFLFRELYKISNDIKDMSLEANGEAKEAVSKAEEKILDLGLNASSNGLVRIGSILKDAADEVVRRSKLTDGISGLSTGFIDLDNMLSGFQKSDLILLAARPSMGKTAIMVNFAVAAANAGKKVAIFSLEMSKEQLALRIFSQLANINLGNLIKGQLEGEDWKRLAIQMNNFSQKKFWIDDTTGLTLMDLRSKLRRLDFEEEGVDLVLIDYLQLMEVSGKIENRQQEISKISRGLKGIAKELDVPVVALSQLSRAPELRSDKRPILSDLRESGAIEQDADVVMFLYRDEYYNADTELKGIGEVIVAKHRNGPTGSISLAYKGEHTKFLNLSRKEDDILPPQ